MDARWLQGDANASTTADPATTTTDVGDDDRPWGDVILASFLIQLATFSGLALAVGVSLYSRVHENRAKRVYEVLHTMVIPSFAAGALLGTVVFLLIPEAMVLLSHHEEGVASEEHDHEERRFLVEVEPHSNAVAWKFGSAVLAGFLLPVIIGAAFPPPDVDQPCRECTKRQAIEGESRASEADMADETDQGLSGAAHANTESKTRHQTQGSSSNISKRDSNGVAANASARSGKANEGVETPLAQCPREVCGKNGSCCQQTKANAALDGFDDNVLDSAAQTPVHGATAANTSIESLSSTLPLQDVPHGSSINYTLAASLIIGDTFHNFTDGIFLGNAFLLCSRSVGYTLVATTVYHELAQELADFCLLTHHCGLPAWKALLANFVAGFSVLVGALLILTLDLSEQSTAMLLAISAGVYVHIAGSECVPRVQARRTSALDSVYFCVCFAGGCVPIGLVLLNHGHCDG